jgi:hypothetical protein
MLLVFCLWWSRVRDFEYRANVISNCPQAGCRRMRVTVRHLLCVDSSDEALNPSSCITGLTDVFEMVSLFGPVTDAVEPPVL